MLISARSPCIGHSLHVGGHPREGCSVVVQAESDQATFVQLYSLLQKTDLIWLCLVRWGSLLQTTNAKLIQDSGLLDGRSFSRLSVQMAVPYASGLSSFSLKKTTQCEFLTPKNYAVQLAIGELCNFPLLSVFSLEVQTVRKAFSKTIKMNSPLGVGAQTTALGASAWPPLPRNSLDCLRGGKRSQQATSGLQARGPGPWTSPSAHLSKADAWYHALEAVHPPLELETFGFSLCIIFNS